MKQTIHPRYGLVLFRDRSTGKPFLTRSTIVDRLGSDHPRQTWEDGQDRPGVQQLTRRYGSQGVSR